MPSEMDRGLTVIGKAVKTHGYQGELVVRLTAPLPESIEEIESLFLLVEGRAVPFMVAGARLTADNRLLVSFDGYGSSEKVAGFTGCSVLADSNFIPEEGDGDGVDIEPGAFCGYTLYDTLGRERGLITEMVENVNQWILTVRRADGKTFAVPVHEEVIAQVDSAQQRLVADIADGLEEL